jgi:hypothetical protein
MLAQFFERHLNHPAAAPDIDRQTLASVRGNYFLDGSFERHLGTLFQRQFKNVCWRLSFSVGTMIFRYIFGTIQMASNE